MFFQAPPRELTEEEKQQVLHSEEFLIFFDRTIRVIERALAEDSDIFFDYSGRDVEEKDGSVWGFVCFCKISLLKKKNPMPRNLTFETKLNILLAKKMVKPLLEVLGHFVSLNYFVK